MNFDECMRYLENVRKQRGITPGLDNMKRLLSMFGNPDAGFRIIHVAGTNGKGSTSAFIANILDEAGFAVGRYISPSVREYCEKIQFVSDGRTEYISRESVAKYITAIKESVEAEDFRPSEFEMETLMSLLSFRDRAVDYVILECGMGGKNDATNAVSHKELCVFTTIDCDHMKYLGNTVEEIAADKAGILTQGCQAVSANHPLDIFYVLEDIAYEKAASIEYRRHIRSCKYSLEGTKFDYRGHTYELGLAGVYQTENAVVAIEAAYLLLENFDYETVSAGLKKTKWPARFEIMSKEPLIIYDGAHNPLGAEKLCESVKKLIGGEEYVRVGIMGVFADKDIPGMAKHFSGVFDEIHTVTAKSGRAEHADTLADIIKKKCDVPVMSHPDGKPLQIINDLEERKKARGDGAGKENAYIVFGTLSMYGDMSGCR